MFFREQNKRKKRKNTLYTRKKKNFSVLLEANVGLGTSN